MKKRDFLEGLLVHLALITSILAMMSLFACFFENKMQKAVSQDNSNYSLNLFQGIEKNDK